MSADRTRQFWQDLGLPGLIDAHVHFLPPNIERAVWREFDAAGPKIGREWPIRYRGSARERVEQLRAFGVRRFSTLPYAHRPGIAGYLNDWSAQFAREVPEAIWSATLYPEPEAGAHVADLIERGVEMIKVHVQVGEFDLNDPLLDAAWGALEDAGTPIMVHAGSGPVGNAHTGPEPMAALLTRFPRLAVIVAHMGSPESREFFELAERFERARLDTSMAFTRFFSESGSYPADLVPRLADLQPKVLYGSDFPTLPFEYADQLAELADLGLGEDWLRDVCWHNGERLFGSDPPIGQTPPMEHGDLIRDERLAFADLLDRLEPEQWATPSLCQGWTVREVAAHVTVGPSGSMREVAVAMLAARGNLARAMDSMAKKRAARPTEELVGLLRKHADSDFTPPGMDWQAPLSDLFLHREDVSRPLGLPSDRPVEGWELVLAFLVTRKARRAFVRPGLPELTYAATDADWTHGSGSVVSGPASSLALAMAGRPAALPDLEGPGAETLAAWVTR